MKKITFLLIAAIIATASSTAQEKKRLMMDLAHGQFKDIYVDSTFYDYVISEYQEILARNDIEYVPNTNEITAESLKGIDVLLMISPLSRSTQIPITEGEKVAIADYIRNGGSLIIMIDEEFHRVILDEYGSNDITSQFGITVGDDIVDVPGNCGAVSI